MCMMDTPITMSPWTVQEHIIPASHPRGFRRAVRDPQTSRLKLHVKEYRPLSSPPSESAVTIIFAHGIGSTKESYEPFFADLLANPATPPIRAIWAADAANHGQSYLLNAAEIGDEHHSFDGAHDIMQMVNYFQSEMRPPLIGMGQSWGIGHILMPAAWHPRFFQGIVLIEVPGGASPRPPTRSGGSKQEKRRASGIDASSFVAKIRDKWPSREAARKHLLKSTYYANFEKRVFEQTVRYELRDVKDGHGEVTLVTPKYQQAIAFSRPDPPYQGYPEGEDYRTRKVVSVKRAGFYRAEPAKMIEAMPTVHCKTLFGTYPFCWHYFLYLRLCARDRDRNTKETH